MTCLTNRGVSLIEVVLVVVIFGILATVALNSGTAMVETARIEETKQELDELATAIVGQDHLHNSGTRASFGYVGDVGAMPPNLSALVTNPGSYSTWNGPYVSDELIQASNEYGVDAWGAAYSYGGGNEIISSGSGGNIVRRLADATADLLSNDVAGNVVDADGTFPDAPYHDSITVVLTHPDGVGGLTSRTTTTALGGYFTFGTVPVGNHQIQFVYEPTSDTVSRGITVLPASSAAMIVSMPSNYWKSAADEPSGLVAHWKLDETSGSIAYDASGLGNHGTLNGFDTTSCWVSGTINGALSFDGNNDYVQIPHADTLNGTKELTYAAWVFSNSWSGVKQVMAKSVHGGGSGRAQMGLFSESNTLTGRVETTSGRINNRVTLPSTGTWAHVASVFDSTQLIVYVDGVPLDTVLFSNRTLRPTTDVLNLGKRVGTSQYFFDGEMDDVRVYRRALTAEEIQTLYSMGG